MATNTTNYNLIKPAYDDDADIKDINDNMDTIDAALANKLITIDEPMAIPAVSVTTYKDVDGMTEDHVLLLWRFSNRGENYPPVNLQWVTHDGYFGVQNDGPATTSVTIQPVFGVPIEKTATAHS